MSLLKEPIKGQPLWKNNEGILNSGSLLRVDLLNPTPEMFNINDIFGALAKICRFGGQLSHFYSVAQHSVLVSRIAPVHLKKAALLHDASEAYLGDVVKPLKNLLGKTYQDIEAMFMAVIFEKFNIDLELLEAVKQYDAEMCEREHMAFQLGGIKEWSDWIKKEHNFTLAVWNPNYAEVVLKAEYFLLFDKEVFI